ncbi:E3 SUMO-protein ligase EGR2 [Ditylenchus destructor]|nr:E3 SUMO-protein ligase EGR2 [Ditylenchus destructor]
MEVHQLHSNQSAYQIHTPQHSQPHDHSQPPVHNLGDNFIHTNTVPYSQLPDIHFDCESKSHLSIQLSGGENASIHSGALSQPSYSSPSSSTSPPTKDSLILKRSVQIEMPDENSTAADARNTTGASPIKMCAETMVENPFLNHSQMKFEGIIVGMANQSQMNPTHTSAIYNNNNKSILRQTEYNNAPATGGRSLSNDRKRPYPCNLCSSKFGSKMELEEHQNSHTGMKPFQCEICQSRFNRRSTLWNHKRIHNDAKPFMCTICQMTFKWKNSLKCHKEMHLRKNETDATQDSDIRLLTYATAAKKRMCDYSTEQMHHLSPMQSSIGKSANLTCAGTPRKRALPRTQKVPAPKRPDLKQDNSHMDCQQQVQQHLSVIFSPKSTKQIKMEDLTPENTTSLLEGSTEDLISQHFGDKNKTTVFDDMQASPSNHAPGLLSQENPQKQPSQHCTFSDSRGLVTPNMLNCTAQNSTTTGLNHLQLDSSFFNCNMPINGLNTQQDLFSHLEHDAAKSSNFLDQNALKMRLPFLNFDFQHFNNSLVDQQAHQLQHTTAFDSFNGFAPQPQSHSHSQNSDPSALFNIPSSSASVVAPHSSTEMFLGGYSFDPALLTAAAAAATANMPTTMGNNDSLPLDYFDCSAIAAPSSSSSSTSMPNGAYPQINKTFLQNPQDHNEQAHSIRQHQNNMLTSTNPQQEDALSALLYPGQHYVHY